MLSRRFRWRISKSSTSRSGSRTTVSALTHYRTPSPRYVYGVKEELKVSREVIAPAEQVWSVITDLDRAAERLSGVNALERVSGPAFDVGTRWRETRKMFGKEATEEMEVASVTPGSAYTVLAESHGSKYESGLRVEASGGARCTPVVVRQAGPNLRPSDR